MSQGPSNSVSNSACMHGIVVQDASARGQLWVQLVLTALNQGRPCVLITELDPASDEFSWVIQHADYDGRFRAAIDDGLLSVFMTTGDYIFNLFRLGARGLLGELDEYGVRSGSVVIIDQADDFFTPHDPAATVRQASQYRRWCFEHEHQVAMLFLRGSPLHPPLAGNQAALSYFNAMIGASVRLSGLHLERLVNAASPVAAFDKLVGRPIANSESMESSSDAVDIYSIFDVSQRSNSHSGRPQAWYIGGFLFEVIQQWPQYAWRRVRDLDELMNVENSADTIVIDVAGDAELRTFANRLFELRNTVGFASHIVVRETDWRIREFPQRRLLKAAGVSVITARHAPFPALGEHSDRSELAGAEQHLVFEAFLSADDDMLGSTRASDLPLSEFVDQARSRVDRNERLGFPCTLAEVVETQLLRETLGRTASGVRPNDLSCQAPGRRLWLLQGCPASESVRVIQRALERSGVFTIAAVSLFADAASIKSRLEALAPPATDGSTSPTSQADPDFGDSMEKPFEQVYREGRYREAAALAHAESALAESAERPLDEEYCFKLAESLESIGQFSSAERHYRRLLKGSSRESEARVALERISELQSEAGLGVAIKVALAEGSHKDLFVVDSVAFSTERAQSSRISMSTRARSIRTALQQTWRPGESDGILPT